MLIKFTDDINVGGSTSERVGIRHLDELGSVLVFVAVEQATAKVSGFMLQQHNLYS